MPRLVTSCRVEGHGRTCHRLIVGPGPKGSDTDSDPWRPPVPAGGFRAAAAGADGHQLLVGAAPTAAVFTLRFLRVKTKAALLDFAFSFLKANPSGAGCPLQQLTPRLTGSPPPRRAWALIVAPTHKSRRVVETGLPGVTSCTVAALLRHRPSICAATGQLIFKAAGRASEAAVLRSMPTPPVLVAVDETSMVSAASVSQIQSLCRRVGAALLLVGDDRQLPPLSSTATGHQAPMAELFTRNPRTARLETVMRAALGSPVHRLCMQLRDRHPLQVWPSQSQRDKSSAVILHRSERAWLDAAAEVINSPVWDESPDISRILCWTHRKAVSLSRSLRERRYGHRADLWQESEWLSFPDGLQTPAGPGQIGASLAPATAEGRIVEVGPPETVRTDLGALQWRTPGRGLQRETQLIVETTAQPAVIDLLHGGKISGVFLELPDEIGTWARTLKEHRALVTRKVSRMEDRGPWFAAALSAAAMVPTVRPAGTMTIHASQGSSFGTVFLAGDVRFGLRAPDARALIYTACSRARHRLELLPLTAGGAAT